VEEQVVITEVQRWGNSQAVRINKQMLSDVDLAVGDFVEIVVRDGAIVLSPVRRVRGAIRLEDLVAAIDGEYIHEEIDWGPPVGKEVR
jgi:antitoxin MazE